MEIIESEEQEKSLMHDTQDYVCSISPSEFEEFCMEVLKSYGEEHKLQNFTIEHNKRIEASDGRYQVDVFASYISLYVEMKILCECKQYSSPVKRERVELLESRLRSLGMNKGILLSTSGFQQGAIQYAKSHGIALIQVYDHSLNIVSHDGGPNSELDEKDPLQYIEDHWPPYRAILFSEESEEPIVLYPTKEIIAPIYAEANKLMKERYGFEVTLDL